MATPSKKLKEAVVAQLGGNKAAREAFRAIAQYGMEYGATGFIYYHETDKFYNKNKADIIAYLTQCAYDYGMGIPDLLGLKDTEALNVERLLDGKRFKDNYFAKNEVVWGVVALIAADCAR